MVAQPERFCLICGRPLPRVRRWLRFWASPICKQDRIKPRP